MAEEIALALQEVDLRTVDAQQLCRNNLILSHC